MASEASSSLTWIHVQSHDNSTNDTTLSPPFTRRSHKKSRGGCLVCKRRKVKCDEQRPRCSQCFSRVGECSYPKSLANLSKPGVDISSRKRDSRPHYEAFPTHVSSLGTYASWVDALAAAQGWQKVASTLDYVELLLCFHNCTVTTLSSPTWQLILKAKALNLTQHHPFLSHSILAFAACHLACMTGVDGFNFMAIHHAQKALELYAKRLYQARDRSELDAMLAACFMLTGLFYLSHDKINTTGSWMSSTQDNVGQIHWATVLSGPTLLLQSSEHTASALESLWLPFTHNSQHSVGQALAESGPGRPLVKILHEICLETCTITCSMPIDMAGTTNIYLPLLNALAPALERHFDPQTMTITPCTDVATYVLAMSFPSRIDASLRQKLAERDPVVFLLVGFWMAILAKLQHCQWWCLQRAQIERIEILRHLSSMQLDDSKLLMVLSILAHVLS